MFKTFNEFKEESTIDLNEGLFDKLLSYASRIANFFTNPMDVQKGVEASVTSSGDKGIKIFNPKNVAINETYFLMMGDGKNPSTNFSIAFTKMADLPNNSGLFAISGTTNEQMLKSLTGTNNIVDLTKQTIVAIISDKSFMKGKPISLKILKNIVPGGKDYTSKFLMTGMAPGTEVQKLVQNNK